MDIRYYCRTRSLLVGPTLLVLSACATLPASGPTAGEIRKHAMKSEDGIDFAIVDITAPLLKDVTTRRAAYENGRSNLSVLITDTRNDVVGIGDVLTVQVYEVGVSLFGGARDMSSGFDPSARGETFPSVVVDRAGAIVLPFTGRLAVAGRTTGEIQDLIVSALRGKSQSPQALVSIHTNNSNTIYVGGDVRRPGRFELSLQRERLLDAVAASGGAASSTDDTIVRFYRNGQTLEERLGRIRPGAPDDLVLTSGDRIELVRRPQTYVVLGASSKVAQIPFDTSTVSLAEAVARFGGPLDAQANPKAVFLFRYDADQSETGKPVIYRLDLMQPASYFLAQRFTMQDKDVIYVANAAANRPTKLIGIINQLFGPLLTARSLSQ